MDCYVNDHVLARFWDDFANKHMIKAMFALAEEKPALVQALFETHVPALFTDLGRHCSGKKFMIADTLRHVDFVVGGWILNVVLNPNFAMHAQFTTAWNNAPENLKTYIANLQDEFKDYLAARPQNCTM